MELREIECDHPDRGPIDRGRRRVVVRGHPARKSFRGARDFRLGRPAIQSRLNQLPVEPYRRRRAIDLVGALQQIQRRPEIALLIANDAEHVERVDVRGFER